MKLSAQAIAIVGCLRIKPLWHEFVREGFYLIGNSPSGLSAALIALVLGMGRRVMLHEVTLASFQTSVAARPVPTKTSG